MISKYEQESNERAYQEYLDAENKDDIEHHKYWQFWHWTWKQWLLWVVIAGILRMIIGVIFSTT